MDSQTESAARLLNIFNSLNLIPHIVCPYLRFPISHMYVSLGEASLKKNGKILEKFPIRLDPPPPSDNSELFEFQKLLKNSDPPPRTKFRKV